VALTVRKQVRLLVALAGPAAAFSVVAAQAEVGKKTNEVLMATVVPGQIDLNNKIVTAISGHCQRLLTWARTGQPRPRNELLSSRSRVRVVVGAQLNVRISFPFVAWEPKDRGAGTVVGRANGSPAS
jgi:hypothetical protein